MRFAMALLRMRVLRFDKSLLFIPDATVNPRNAPLRLDGGLAFLIGKAREQKEGYPQIPIA